MRRRDFLKMFGVTAVATTVIPGMIDPFNHARAAISPGEKGIYITNISVATINGLNTTARIVRLDTNKGISGYGECRVEDTNSGTELRTCKPVIMGMNPTQVDKVFEAITAAVNPTSDWKKITYASGAIAAIECACWDITGKVYNVPIWKLLGPKLNDSMRMYCDTPVRLNLSQRKAEIQDRINKGFTWFKTDLNGILTSSDYKTSPDPNPYTESGGSAKRILESGYTKFRDYVASFRQMIGDQPLSADHFFDWSPRGGGNQLDVASAIQLSNYLAEPGYLDKSLGGWMEDIIPWHYYTELAQINAGSNWTQIVSADSSIDILSIVKLDSRILAGTWNGFIQSTDDGTSWSVFSPTGIAEDAAIWSVVMINTTLFAGTTGDIYKSTDNGNTWTEISSGIAEDARITSIVASGDNIYAVSANNGVFKLASDGTSWTAVNTDLTDTHISQLVALDNKLFAVTLTGVFISDNSGTSWAADPSVLKNVNCLVALNNQLLAGTDNDGVYLSDDNGVTWTSFSTGLPDDTRIWSIAISSEGIFAGTSSGIWVTDSPTGVDVEKEITVPLTFALKQNYPNPFKTSTNISFSIPTESYVSLKIYDRMGREVATIFSEESSAGYYTREWNAANIPGGIYFYRLQAGSFSETKKLIVLP